MNALIFVERRFQRIDCLLRFATEILRSSEHTYCENGVLDPGIASSNDLPWAAIVISKFEERACPNNS